MCLRKRMMSVKYSKLRNWKKLGVQWEKDWKSVQETKETWQVLERGVCTKFRKDSKWQRRKRRKGMRMENETPGKGRCRRCVDNTGNCQSMMNSDAIWTWHRSGKIHSTPFDIYGDKEQGRPNTSQTSSAIMSIMCYSNNVSKSSTLCISFYPFNS